MSLNWNVFSTKLNDLAPVFKNNKNIILKHIQILTTIIGCEVLNLYLKLQIND